MSLNFAFLLFYSIFENAPDSVAIDMKTKFGIICIACVYRSTSLSDNLNSQLIDCISSICKETNDYETIQHCLLKKV